MLNMSSIIKIIRCGILYSLMMLAFILPLPVCAASAALKPVTLQLRWDHQFQFAGYYAADWLGYYQDEGIDVDIRSAFSSGKILDATREVAEGRAQFGVGAADILIARDQGNELSLVASFFQRSAVAYYALEDTRFSSVYDLARLNIARREHDLLDVELQALFLSEGIHPFTSIYADVPRDFTVEDLTSGKYDLVPGYLGKLPYQAAKQGVPIRTVQPIEYGIDFYGDTLFTSKELAGTNPELVEKFRRATVKGWGYALEHPDEIADKIAAMAYAAEKTGQTLEQLKDFNRYQAQKVLELTHYPIVEIGNINPYRWAKMAATLKELGIISHEPAVDRMIFDYQAVRLNQLKKTGENAIAAFTVALIITTLVFIINLKRRNILLKQEIKGRQRTERLLTQSNIRYETIFKSSVLGITMTNQDGKILHCNTAWLQMTGYDEDEMAQMRIQELIAPESVGVDEEQMLALLSGAVSSYIVEKKYRRKPAAPDEDSFFYGKLFMTRIYDPETDGMVNMAMVMDITRDLELERLFKHELDENRKKEALILYQSRMAAMGEMIGNIAHQWRQPLNTLRLILSNLQDISTEGQPDPEYSEAAFRKSHALIEKMSVTIDDFRYFSNPRNEAHEFDVLSTLKIATELMDEQLRVSCIELDISCTGSPRLYGMDNQLSHALFNILTNAADALKTYEPPSGSPRRISVRIGETASETVITIADNGPGIQAEDAERIFDMYYTTHGEDGGTGLGLYMAKTIVENSFHGRLMLIESFQGACFQILIPREQKETL